MIQENIFVLIGSLLAISTLCQWLAWRVRLPAIIFLLGAGILLGPVLGLLDPEEALGDFFFPFVSLSVSIILFEGSLTLKFRDILGFQTVIRNMLSLGMGITWLITSLATHFLIHLSWPISFLFGAVTVVTGPTVITPILRTVRPSSAVANILRWEGIVIDPLGAALAVLVYEYIISGQDEVWAHTMLTFGKLVSVGMLVGMCSGYLWGLALRFHWLPGYLRNVSTLALVIVSFIVANGLQPESGLVTVTVMGIWLANMHDVDVQEIVDFKESISILLISLLFILLAARVDVASMAQLGWRPFVLFLVIQFLARPLNILISATGSRLSWPERHLLAWIAPRGIVAAAISSLFAVQLSRAGYGDAALLSPLTFFVIISTVLLQSTTARPLALWLNVAEPEPHGFLIIGANAVARAIGKAIAENGVQVVLTDTIWSNISKAKFEGLSTYYGSAISEHADRHLTLTGLGRMLALSAHENVNVAAAMHYRMELGPENVFFIQGQPREKVSARVRLPIQRVAQTLFSHQVSYSSLASLLSRGGRLTTTKLSPQFTYEQFLARHGAQALLLFALDLKGAVHVFTAEKKPEPKNGWRLISVLPPQKRRVWVANATACYG